ncbi:MAG: methyltransferase domain-containing protein, partial [Vicinamibacteria bacterium]|nr:methyltransferase domain-containing protein [Vicinamibacteria bacterium]
MNDSITAGVKKFYEERHDAIEGHRLVRRYYRATLIQGLKDRIIPGQRVLDIGCGTGDLLATLRPSYGVGVDLSRRAIETARAAHRGEQLHFVEGDGSDPAVLRELGGPFDVILLVNVVTHLRDVQATLEALQAVSHARTRIFIYSFSRVWQPLIRLSEMLGLKERQPFESWLPSEEVRHMLQLADYEIVRQDNLIFCPAGIPLVAPLLNRYVGHLPFIEIGAVMFGLIARPIPARHAGARSAQPSVSVIIPCRNEAGHIPELVRRLPNLPPNSEFLFVEGNSTDDSEAAIR